MCGICGELEFSPGAGSSEDEFNSLVDMMARRGPDDRGTWMTFPDQQRSCRLGFRRLAILDLSAAANQPMLAGGGRFALVYNGELYNFKKLRSELEQQGVQFYTSGDTEVVLQALIHWGKKALDRFNGMFALGFFDREEGSLLLARDHAGIKPVYYLLSEQGLFFASQYDQILAHKWRSGLSVSPAGLGLYLRLGYIPAPYAILEHTHLLEPGSWLQVTAEGCISRGIYYTFPPNSRPDLTAGEAYEAVNAAVGAAVKRQMISDVPLGAFLSGGIDSPLVTAKMQLAANGPIRAYTIGSAGSRFDESEDASAYARSLGVDHMLEQFTPDQVINHIGDVIAACGEPFADYSIFPTLYISGLARRDLTVMLSGDGGDELFWGYAERFASVLRLAEDFRRPYWQRSARWAAKRYLAIGNAHPNFRWLTIGHWYRQKHTRLAESLVTRLFPEISPWPAEFNLFEYAGSELDQTAQWLRWNEFVGHLTMVLLKVDRASMYHSLEVRVPLLDREVIDIATRVDWHSCLDLRTGTGKLPLRAALARHTDHQTQAKRGFTVPMADWLRGPLREVLGDLVLSRREWVGLAVDPRALKKIVDAHLSGEADLANYLWLLLSLALWEDRYLGESRRLPSALGNDRSRPQPAVTF